MNKHQQDKTTHRRLRLSKETVRLLDSRQLRQVVGGITATKWLCSVGQFIGGCL